MGEGQALQSIPDDIKALYFPGGYSAFEIQLSETEAKDISDLIGSKKNNLNQLEKIRSLLVVAYSHTNYFSQTNPTEYTTLVDLTLGLLGCLEQTTGCLEQTTVNQIFKSLIRLAGPIKYDIEKEEPGISYFSTLIQIANFLTQLIESDYFELLKHFKAIFPRTFNLVLAYCWNANFRENTAFSIAAKKSNLPILQWLIEGIEGEVGEDRPDLISSKNILKTKTINLSQFVETYKTAAENKHLEIIKWLVVEYAQKHPDFSKYENLQAEYFDAIFTCAAEKSLEDLRFISTLLHDHFLKLNVSLYQGVFTVAAIKANLDILNWFGKQVYTTSSLEKDYVTAILIYENASHSSVLDWLEKRAPNACIKFSRITKKRKILDAAKNGQLDILKWHNKDKYDLKNLLEVNSYSHFYFDSPFIAAAEYGHIDVLNWFAKTMPDQLQRWIYQHDFASFRSAIEEGQVDIVQWLAVKAPQFLQRMITSITRGSGSRIHSKVLQFLIDQASTENIQLLLSPFTRSIDEDTYHILFHFPDVFAYAEVHIDEYGQFANNFIEKKISTLLQRYNSTGTENLIKTQEEAKLCFYMLRHLFRICPNPPSETILEKIDFLLKIPAVESCLHLSIGKNGRENDLLRLAMENNNQTLVEKLMAYPMVRYKATQSNFYQNENTNGLNLQDIVNNTESSMGALTPHQTKLCECIIKLYLDNHDIGNLKAELTKRYEAKPATFKTKKDNTILLPLEWEAFQKQKELTSEEENGPFKAFYKHKLTPDEKEAAFKAYYKHPTHTVYRFLLMPNPWIDPKTTFACTPDQTKPDEKGAWIQHTNLQLMIASYFAVADKSASPTDGFETVEDRIEEWMRAIAEIARAHNWDKTKIVKINGKKVSIAYDDEGPDQPSCPSGMPKRFIEAPKGIPLIHNMDSYIESTFRSILRNQFQAFLDGASAEELEGLHALLLKLVQLPTTETMDLINQLLPKFTPLEAFEQPNNEGISLKNKIASLYDETNDAVRDCFQQFNKIDSNFQTYGTLFFQYYQAFGLDKMLEAKLKTQKKTSHQNKLKPTQPGALEALKQENKYSKTSQLAYLALQEKIPPDFTILSTGSIEQTIFHDKDAAIILEAFLVSEQKTKFVSMIQSFSETNQKTAKQAQTNIEALQKTPSNWDKFCIAVSTMHDEVLKHWLPNTPHQAFENTITEQNIKAKIKEWLEQHQFCMPLITKELIDALTTYQLIDEADEKKIHYEKIPVSLEDLPSDPKCHPVGYQSPYETPAPLPKPSFLLCLFAGPKAQIICLLLTCFGIGLFVGIALELASAGLNITLAAAFMGVGGVAALVGGLGLFRTCQDAVKNATLELGYID